MIVMERLTALIKARIEDRRQYNEEKKNLTPLAKCSNCRSSIVSEEMLLSRNNKRKRSNVDQDSSLSEETTSLRPWSKLPGELVEMVGSKMKSADDCARFRSVCMSWKDGFDNNVLRLSLPRQLPLLVSQKVCPYRLHHVPELRETSTSSYNMKLNNIPGGHWSGIGSTEGWLVFVEHQGEAHNWSSSFILLVNPFREKHIRLPTLQLGRVKKVVLSTNPTWNKDYVVMAIYGVDSRIAFCRSSDETWTKMGDNMFFEINDVIYYRNQFHMIDLSGHVYVVSNIFTSPVLECVAHKKIMVASVQLYLVDLSGDLLLVQRDVDESHNTIWFQVSKMDPVGRVFTKVEDLGEHLLFLGSISSVSVLASHFSGCYCSNRIYFKPQTGHAYFWIEPQLATSLK